MKDQIYKSFIPGIASLGLSLYVWLYISDLGEGAAAIPGLIAIVLAILSLLLIISGIKEYNQLNKEYTQERQSADQDKGKFTSLKMELYPFTLIIVCIVFLLLFDSVGFDIGAAVLLFAAMLLIDAKEAVRKFYLVILIPLVLVLIFKFGLSLRLPLFFQDLVYRFF